MGVAFIGFIIIYTTYRYNLIYVYSSEHDTRGLHYPRALKQTLTGVYLAEICLLGLFGLRAAFGPLLLIIALLVFTFLVHASLNAALSPLLYNLPRTLAVEEEFRRAGYNGLEFNQDDVVDIEDADQNPYDSDFDPSDPNKDTTHHSLETTDRSFRDIQGKSAVAKLTTRSLGAYFRIKFANSPIPAFLSRIDFWTPWISPDPNVPPNFVIRWLHPEIFADYPFWRAQLPNDWPEIVYEEGVVKEAFCPPGIRSRAPRLWIPRDVAGVSAQEVAHSGKVIGISDEGASLLRCGALNVDVERDWREGWEKVRW